MEEHGGTEGTISSKLNLRFYCWIIFAASDFNCVLIVFPQVIMPSPFVVSRRVPFPPCSGTMPDLMPCPSLGAKGGTKAAVANRCFHAVVDGGMNIGNRHWRGGGQHHHQVLNLFVSVAMRFRAHLLLRDQLARQPAIISVSLGDDGLGPPLKAISVGCLFDVAAMRQDNGC